MDYSKLFLSSFGGGDDPSSLIGQSLRFRGNQRLTASAADFMRPEGDFTLSLWIKHARAGNTNDSVSIFGNNDSTRGYKIGSSTNASNGDMLACRDGSSVNTFGSARFRDVSAWYHLVYQNTGEITTCFVNGQQLPNTQNTFPRVGDLVFGSGNPGSMDEAFTGYMAEIYCIDGQILDPIVFGQYTEDDVWVPAKPNFGMGQSRYSDFVTTANGGGWMSGRTPEKMFNPETSAADGETAVNSNGDAIVFAPKEPITFTTSLEVFTSSTPGTGAIYLNDPSESGPGVDVGLNVWVTVATGAGQIEDLRIRCPSTKANCAGIKVDGEQLLNPYLWSTYLTTDNPGGFQEPASNAFNGSLADPAAMSGNTGGILTWAPPSFEFNQKIEVYCKAGLTSASYIASWNGNDVNYVHDTWVTVYEGSGLIDNTFPLTIQADPNDQAALAAIRIDGKLVVDGVNNSYGANGFHLDFSDPNDLGADRSGNGNDFTPNGFNTTTVGIFSSNQWGSAPGNYETEASGNRYQPILAINAFNGDIMSQSQVEPPQSWWYWVQSLTGVNTLRFNYGGGATPSEVRVNGDVAAFTVGNSGPAAGGGANNWCDVTVPADGIVNELAWTDVGGTSNTNTYCVELNGNILEDNTGADYDLMQDNPTQNYATGNPLMITPAGGNSSRVKLEDANLKYSGVTSQGQIGSTFYLPQNEGKFYWEYTDQDTHAVYPQLGLRRNSFATTDPGGFTGQTPYFMLIQKSGSITSTQQNAANNILVTYAGLARTTGDVLGAAFDASRGKIWFSVNGVFAPESGSPTGAGTECDGFDLEDAFDWSPHVMTNQTGGASLNFGQQPFVYTPPEGFTSLQTQNLPAATIRNGRDHFQALTGPGQGADAGIPNALLGDFASNCFFTPAGATVDFGTTAAFPAGGSSRANGFDGDLTTIMSSGPANSGIVFRPSTPISATSKVEIYYAPAGNITQEIYVNSSLVNSFASTTAGWRDISADLTFPLTIQNMAFKGTGSFAGGYVTAIRVDDKILRDGSILGIAQSAFPNGLWWIKDRVNTNQHQLVDSVRGSTVASTCPQSSKNITYVAPAGDSIAWCWNSADPTTSGFNIIEFTGDANSTQDVAHGLPGTPEFIITGSQAASPGGFETFHVGCAAGQSVTIDAPRAQNTSSRYSGVDGTNITYGGDYNTNGQLMIAYAWTSIPGYSAFGSVTRGQDAFAYTGFRPAFLLTKQTGASGDWLLWDTTRNINNPSTIVSIVNGQQAEESGGTQQVDLLSNGIKFRGTSGSMSGNLIWAAFAENPFNISNAR